MKETKNEIPSKDSDFWFTADNKLLKKLFHRESIEQIAQKLGRTVWATRKQGYRLGLKKRYQRYWTPDELELLKSLWLNQSTGQIAVHLNRSYGSVAVKAHTLGLKRIR